jgi:alpha-beta hydrolase superfamily lysophospholipase
MHYSAYSKISTFPEEAISKDIILEINNFKRIGAKLGRLGTLLAIKNAQHDLFISPKIVREKTYNVMFAKFNTIESENKKQRYSCL